MNTILNRRRFTQLLLSSTALSLVDCSAAQVASWVAGEQAVGQEFVIVEPELAAAGFNAATPIPVTISGVTKTTTLAGVGTLIQQLTTALGAASTASQGQSTLIEIETYINALTPIIWPIVSPFITAASPGAGFTIGLIVAALPALEAALNFAVDFGGTILTSQAQQLAKLAPPVPAAAKFGTVGVVQTPSEVYLNMLVERANARH